MQWPQHDPDVPKPKLRGVSHALGAVIALPSALWLYSSATNISAQIGALIYGLSLVGLLSVSAIYHTFRWSEVMRLHMRRLDRSMIFVLTAGTQTPFLLVGKTTGNHYRQNGAGLGLQAKRQVSATSADST